MEISLKAPLPAAATLEAAPGAEGEAGWALDFWQCEAVPQRMVAATAAGAGR
jgi:hypothetical protein